jgi:hypothetical protein
LLPLQDSGQKAGEIGDESRFSGPIGGRIADRTGVL